MKKQSGKNKSELMRNLFLIKININRAGIFPLNESTADFNQRLHNCWFVLRHDSHNKVKHS